MKKIRLVRSPIPLLLILVYCTLLCRVSFAVNTAILPPLTTDQQKLEFLLAIRKQVPRLFRDAAQYDINLFELLGDQEKLVEALKKADPGYTQAFENRPYLTLTITPPAAGIEVGSVVIKPEAIEAWKKEVLEKLHTYRQKNKDGGPAELISKINTLHQELVSDDGAHVFSAVDQIGALPKGDQLTKIRNELNPLLAGKKDRKSRIEVLINHYDRFKDLIERPGTNLNHDQLKRGIQIIDQKEELGDLLNLWVLAHRNLPNETHKNWESFEGSIKTLSTEDLIHFIDKADALDPRVRKTLNAETKISNEISNALFKRLDYFASQRSKTTEKVTQAVRLQEVPPALGIFRGCVGGDCSSRYSFPYPNDPHERVFFIEDPKNAGRLKGYVAATVVTQDGKQALYVNTISGANVTAGNTELILRAFEKDKETLGVNRIFLPTPSNLAGLINYPQIAEIYKDHSSKQSEPISYQGPAVRNKIQAYRSLYGYNSGPYDHMESNRDATGIYFKSKKDLDTIQVVTQSNPGLQPPQPAALKNQTEPLLAFVIDLKNSGRSELLDRTLKIPEVNTHLTSKGLSHFLEALESCQRDGIQLTQSEHETYLKDILTKKIGIQNPNFLTKPVNFLYPGNVSCSDAFAPNNIEKTAEDLVHDANSNSFVPRTVNLERIYQTVGIREKLNKTKAFKSLINNILTDLNDENYIKWSSACTALTKIKPTDPLVQQVLVDALKNGKKGQFGFTECTTDVFKAIQPTDPAILAAIAAHLKDPDSEVSRSAAEALGAIKAEDPAILAAIVAHMKDPDPDVRNQAISALRVLKPKDPAIHRALADALKDPDEFTRGNAAVALTAIKPTDPAIHRALAEALNDRSELLAVSAATALGNLNTTDPAIHRALAEALKNHKPSIRRSAAKALMEIKPKDSASLAAIAAHLKDPDPEVRIPAAILLGEIKLEDPTSLPAIVAHLKDPDPSVRFFVANLLQEIKPKDPVSLAAIAAHLKNPDSRVRESVINLLVNIKPTDSASLAAIAVNLNDPDSIVRASVENLLKEIKPTDPAILAAIVAHLKDPDNTVRFRATELLWEIKPTDPAILAAIVAHLKDPDPAVRKSAATALSHLNTTDPAIHRVLAEALNDPNPSVRFSALFSLLALNPTDPKVHAEIIQALKNPHCDAQLKNELIKLLHEIVHNDATKAHLKAALQEKAPEAAPPLCRNIDTMKPGMNVEDFMKLMDSISDKIH